MSTIQSIFNRMEVLDRELQLQSGEADVTRGLAAVNMAQDHFEAIVATRPHMLATDSSTKSANLTATASTETTTYPAGLLRLDGLWLLDSSTSLPKRRLNPMYGDGAHRIGALDTVQNLVASTASTGEVRQYWTNGVKIFWDPLPDTNQTIRWYGFLVNGDYTAAGDTFAYPDVCRGPFAAFAARMFEFGLDDPERHYGALADELFGPVIELIENFRREGAQPVRTADWYEGVL